jgi:cytoskeletal protein CcmA (bactofilin family)
MILGPTQDRTTWGISTTADRFSLFIANGEPVTNTLTVDNEATATDTLTVNRSFTANAASETNKLIVTDGLTTTDNLTVNGRFTANAASETNKLIVTDDTTTTNDLTVDSNIAAGQVTVSGVFTANVGSETNKLTVNDEATTTDRLAVNGRFTANAASETNKLAVDDETTVTDKLTVNGSVTAGELVVNGSFTANSNSTTNKLAVTDESTTTNKLTVNGVHFETQPNANLKLNIFDFLIGAAGRRADYGFALSDMTTRLCVNWDRSWADGVLIDSDASVAGALSANGALTVNAASETNKLAVDDEATTTDKLTVNGSATAGELSVTGTVTGSQILSDTLTVSGTTETNRLHVNGVAIDGESGGTKALKFAITDLMIGGTGGTGRKPVGTYGRALVDDQDDYLVLNYGVDWTNGVKVSGNLTVDDRLYVKVYKDDHTYFKYISYGVGGLGTAWESAYFYPKDDSDARLKQNIRGIDGALAKIDALRPVEFEWNELAYRKFTAGVEDKVRSVEGDPQSDADLWETERRRIRQERGGTHRGFIAQEVERVFPEWIETDSEGYRRIDTSELCSVLVKAVQEMRAEHRRELEQLKSEIAMLKGLRHGCGDVNSANNKDISHETESGETLLDMTAGERSANQGAVR